MSEVIRVDFRNKRVVEREFDFGPTAYDERALMESSSFTIELNGVEYSVELDNCDEQVFITPQIFSPE